MQLPPEPLLATMVLRSVTDEPSDSLRMPPAALSAPLPLKVLWITLSVPLLWFQPAPPELEALLALKVLFRTAMAPPVLSIPPPKLALLPLKVLLLTLTVEPL